MEVYRCTRDVKFLERLKLLVGSLEDVLSEVKTQMYKSIRNLQAIDK